MKIRYNRTFLWESNVLYIDDQTGVKDVLFVLLGGEPVLGGSLRFCCLVSLILVLSDASRPEGARQRYHYGCRLSTKYEKKWHSLPPPSLGFLSLFFSFFFLISSGKWVKIKLKLPHLHVSDTYRIGCRQSTKEVALPSSS